MYSLSLHPRMYRLCSYAVCTTFPTAPGLQRRLPDQPVVGVQKHAALKDCAVHTWESKPKAAATASNWCPRPSRPATMGSVSTTACLSNWSVRAWQMGQKGEVAREYCIDMNHAASTSRCQKESRPRTLLDGRSGAAFQQGGRWTWNHLKTSGAGKQGEGQMGNVSLKCPR